MRQGRHAGFGNSPLGKRNNLTICRNSLHIHITIVNKVMVLCFARPPIAVFSPKAESTEKITLTKWKKL